MTLRYLRITRALVRGGFADADPVVAEVARQTLAMPDAASDEAPLFAGAMGWLAVDDATGQYVGTCAFTDRPSDEGEVEIAYFAFPGFEGRGVATEMAGHLVSVAREAGSARGVRAVIAHTLAEASASVRVLERLGFTNVGESVDPVDGPIWRWRLPLPRT